MKIEIAKRDLFGALQVVKNSVLSTGDISSHYVFRYRDNKLEVFSFAGRVWSSAPVKAVVDASSGVEAFTVEAGRLMGVLSLLGDVALTLSHDREKKITTVSWEGGDAVLASLDPADFPFWDGLLESCVVMCKVSASALSSALQYAKRFSAMGEEENRKPELCVVQAREGSLYSTDTTAVAIVGVPGMEKTTFRVHQGDVSSVAKYLGTIKDGDVEILEHQNKAAGNPSRAVLFRREDGAVFGESRPMADYPHLAVNRQEEPTVAWTFSKLRLEHTLKLLEVQSANDGGDYVTFRQEKPDAVLVGRVTQATKKQKFYEVSLEDFQGQHSLLPEAGFRLKYTDILKVLGFWESDTFGMSVHVKSPRVGFVRYLQEREGLDILTVAAWIK